MNIMSQQQLSGHHLFINVTFRRMSVDGVGNAQVYNTFGHCAVMPIFGGEGNSLI